MKILLSDIETAPNLATVWGLWGQNIAINQIMAAGYTLCWSAKWLGDDEVMFDSVHKSSATKMLKRIHSLLDECDAVVTYNGDKFDLPTLSKDFLTHGMKPPAPYKSIDLCTVAKKQFRFPSNKLDYIAQALGIGKKTEHAGHQLWIDCMALKPDAWAVMEEYNKNDVVILEGVYERMRPWIRQHPNHGLYDEPGVPVCTNCGSGHLQRRGFARTGVNKYARYQCQECGTWTREAYSELGKEDRGIIMRRDLG